MIFFANFVIILEKEEKMAQHISIRIPWHDNEYKGTVCKNPCDNTACLRLKNIYENRNQEMEQSLAGKPMIDHEQ